MNSLSSRMFFTVISTIMLVFVLPLSLCSGKEGSEGRNSKISSVVVYPNHAQVTREIVVKVKDGENSVKFTNLVSILNPQNLRATASDGIRITGTETKKVFLKESHTDEIKKLDAKIQSTMDSVEALSTEKDQWAEEKLFYTSIKDRVAGEIGKELSNNKISVEDWAKTLEFIRQGVKSCDKEMASRNLAIRSLNKELDMFNRERISYAQRRTTEMKEVTVSFTSDQVRDAVVRIHYIVPAASWTPVYDVHLNKGVDEVQMIGYGDVTQWTGETWNDVSLTLAMSRPDFQLSLPELKPTVVSFDAKEMQMIAKDIYTLNSNPVSEAKNWSRSRFKGQQDLFNFQNNLEQLAYNDDSQLMQYGLNREIVKQALSRLVDRFAGVRYKVSQNETIPCDSSPHKVVVFSGNVPVSLKHVATPTLGDTVVLKGDMKNTTGYPILEGNVSLFIDNSYVGASRTDSAAQNEEISFCFGPDDALVVARELMKRDVKGPEKFRQSQVITYSYKINAENFNDHKSTVQINDQIPTSKNQDIQVKFVESNIDYTIDEQTGKLTWFVDIERGKKKEITFSFSVECPVERTLYWK